MKKQFLVLALLLLASIGYAENETKYCELSVYQPNFKRYVARISYSASPALRSTKIKDAAGNTIRFASELAALGYVTKDGWELITVYHTRDGHTHFFLKK